MDEGAMEEEGMHLWRVPGCYNSPLHERVRYRPILGGHSGTLGPEPVRETIKAFVWHWKQGSLPLTANTPQRECSPSFRPCLPSRIIRSILRDKRDVGDHQVRSRAGFGCQNESRVIGILANRWKLKPHPAGVGTELL